jgi:hypothetical protein
MSKMPQLADSSGIPIGANHSADPHWHGLAKTLDRYSKF